MRRFISSLTLAAFTATLTAAPLELFNRKSGISLAIDGVNGKDYAVEHTYADGMYADVIIYLKNPATNFSLKHNENNVLTLRDGDINWHLGVGEGPEFGIIYAKFDHDMLAHPYTGDVPEWIIRGDKPFNLAAATYKDGKPVVGTVGNNGGEWGSVPKDYNQERFYYGMKDAFDNEWHTLTYWDDDIKAIHAQGKKEHRQGASDGHWVAICVAPKTPVLQFSAPDGKAQFYTTPLKTYFSPVIREQTTYATGDVTLNVVNLTNADPVMFRAGDSAWANFPASGAKLSTLVTAKNQPVTLEFKNGASGTVLTRTVVLDPAFPAPEEKHGFMLWESQEKLDAIRSKVQNVSPFKEGYAGFRTGYLQGEGPYLSEGIQRTSDKRGIWRDVAAECDRAFSNAVKIAIEGATDSAGEMLKSRLLYISRLEPVGNEGDVNSHTPAKDYMNELSQTIVSFIGAALAYDIAAAHYRTTHHPDGLTPIEEYYIRDGLAKVAKTQLQFRDNYGATHGGGDTHWPMGFEQTIGMIALAMPTYDTPYYGVSGGDFKKTDPSRKANYDPFPDQFTTWYQAVTDSQIATPGHPGIRYPLRWEFLLTDDGWWTGPNNLLGNGERYYVGSMGNRLVDVKHGGMFNAECLVELDEMGGYEAPFVGPGYMFLHTRAIKGDPTPIPWCAQMYYQRRSVNGVTAWAEKNAERYVAAEPDYHTSLLGFNKHSGYGEIPKYHEAVKTFLDSVTSGSIDVHRRKVINSPAFLVMCDDPAALPSRPIPAEALPPTVRPMFKYVFKPGQKIEKPIIVQDMQGRELKTTISDLPKGATHDSKTNLITFTATEPGVWPIEVTTDNGQFKATRPFVFICKESPATTQPAPPANFVASLTPDKKGVKLSWDSASSAKYYLVYREGALQKVLPADTTEWTDTDRIIEGSHTRYDLAYLTDDGTESNNAPSKPDIISP